MTFYSLGLEVRCLWCTCMLLNASDTTWLLYQHIVCYSDTKYLVNKLIIEVFFHCYESVVSVCLLCAFACTYCRNVFLNCGGFLLLLIQVSVLKLYILILFFAYANLVSSVLLQLFHDACIFLLATFCNRTYAGLSNVSDILEKTKTITFLLVQVLETSAVISQKA